MQRSSKLKVSVLKSENRVTKSSKSVMRENKPSLLMLEDLHLEAS